MRLAALLAPLVLVGAAACGSGDDDTETSSSESTTTTSTSTTSTSTSTTTAPPEPPTTAPPAPPPTPPSTSLSVEATANNAPLRSGSVACGDPATGDGHLADQSAATAACNLVRDNADATKLLLEGPPADQICTKIYGGPELAVVSGQIDGQAVDVTIDRTDGCGIAEWDMLAPLLGPAGS